MALLRALPVQSRIHRRRRRRLAADRGRIQQQLRAHQRHDARALGKTLIPADGGTDAPIAGIEYPKAGITGGEIELLLVARAVRDMRLAVDAEPPAIGIEHRQRIEIDIARALKEADRQYHLELRRQGAEAPQQGAVVGTLGELQVPCILFDAEIRGGEQLLQQDDLGAAGMSIAHQPLSAIEVRGQLPAAGELRRRDRHLAAAGAHASAAAGAPCTRSVMAIAVRNARKPSSPPTSTRRSPRMTARNDWISASSASP